LDSDMAICDVCSVYAESERGVRRKKRYENSSKRSKDRDAERMQTHGHIGRQRRNDETTMTTSEYSNTMDTE